MKAPDNTNRFRLLLLIGAFIASLFAYVIASLQLAFSPQATFSLAGYHIGDAYPRFVGALTFVFVSVLPPLAQEVLVRIKQQRFPLGGSTLATLLFALLFIIYCLQASEDFVSILMTVLVEETIIPILSALAVVLLGAILDKI